MNIRNMKLTVMVDVPERRLAVSKVLKVLEEQVRGIRNWPGDEFWLYADRAVGVGFDGRMVFFTYR